MRGSAVTPGYYKEPEATARDFRDGWLNTGDLAVVHPDGYLELLDRRHDIVILDGEHVSSIEIEIEQTLAQHPTVAELSRTSSGKVPKNILREKEWAGHEKRIHGV